MASVLKCSSSSPGTGALINHVFKSKFSMSACKSGKHYKMVIAGAGTGGTSTANRFAKKFGEGQVAVIEPCDNHYYQPYWTLVGGGLKKFENSVKPMREVLPSKCVWIKDAVASFQPEKNSVTTAKGEELTYDVLVVACGLSLRYDLIKGLPEAFEKDPMLCSNYSSTYVHRTFPAIKNFKEGNAIFTFPNTPIKCAGAPQKIMWLTEDYLRKNGRREKANMIFNTSLGVIFGVKKYADELLKLASKRNIQINYKHNLIEVKPDTKEAVFEILETGENVTMPYSMMHVTPPMTTVPAVKNSSLVDAAGFVEVVKETLQHTKYKNVFSLGDSSSAPTSKTAAAIASQSGVCEKSINAFLAGKEPKKIYDGYTSCPLIVTDKTVILAEFDFDAQPLETFPINQGVERRTMYHLTSDILPVVYWNMLLKGNWNGPTVYRKLMHLGMSR